MIVKINSIMSLNGEDSFQISFHSGKRLVSWGEPNSKQSRMTEFTEAVAKVNGDVVIATVSRFHEDVPNPEKAWKFAFKKLIAQLKSQYGLSRVDTAKFWDAYANLSPEPKFNVVCKSAAQKERDKELKAQRKAMRASLRAGLANQAV